jgi:hypothetical protein
MCAYCILPSLYATLPVARHRTSAGHWEERYVPRLVTWRGPGAMCAALSNCSGAERVSGSLLGDCGRRVSANQHGGEMECREV